MQTTGTEARVVGKLSLNSTLFGAAIWGHFVALFWGKKIKRTEHHQLFTVMWSAVCAVGVLF
jgi:hypothetical protein